MLWVQTWLLLKRSNKKQSNKNKYHFDFSLGDFAFEGGEALFCYMESPAALRCYHRNDIFFIKAPWDFSEIGSVSEIGIVNYASAFGENLFA